MSTRRLVAGKPYLMNAGVNFDANALIIKDSECNGITNLRVLPFELVTRNGCKRVASNVPSGDPILHFHTFKKPNAIEEVFAFTKRNIYKMNQGVGDWTLAQEHTTSSFVDLTNWTLTIPGGDVTTQFTTDGAGWISWSAVLANSAYAPCNPGQYKLIYSWGTKDLHTYGGLQLYINTYIRWAVTVPGQFGTPDTLAPCLDTWRINLCSDTAGATAIESYTFTFPAGGTNVFTGMLNVPFANPAALTAVKSISLEPIDIPFPYSYFRDHTFALEFSSPFLFYADIVGDDQTFWSSQDYVDLSAGSTVVAAGSTPPRPTDSEGDGGTRCLLYYDQSAGYFKPLVTRSTQEAQNEATGQDGGGTSAGPFAGTVTHTPVKPFTFFITSGSLILGDNGSGVLYDVNGGAGTGTINYTTGAWTATFSSNVGGIQTTYSYYITNQVLPRFVSVLNNRVIFMNCYEDSLYMPWRIRWSEAGDMTTVRGVSYRDMLDDDTSPISGCAYSSEYLTIYRHDSIAKMKTIGGDSVFGFFTVWQSGTFAPSTILSWNNYNFFLGKDDVYRFDGTQCVSIATQRVRNKIFALLNKNKILNCFSSYDDQYKEYWLWIVTEGNTFPTSVFVYSLQYDTWSYFTYPEISAVGAFYVVATKTWDSLVGTWNQQAWRWSDGTLEGTIRVPLLAKYGGDVFAIDYRLVEDFISDTGSTPITWSIITKDFVYANLEFKDRTSRVHFEAKGKQVTVGNSCNYEQDVSAFQDKIDVALNSSESEYQYWPDKVHEHIRFSFEGSGQFSLRWIQPFAITQEKD